MNSLMILMVGLTAMGLLVAGYAPNEYKPAAVIPMLAMLLLIRLFIWRRR